jgi:hypothetical protein
MLRVGSLFRAALLVSAIAACAKREEGIRTVEPEAYASRPCWFNSGGDFTAFLVLAREGEVAVPYPVSGKCLVEAGHLSLGAATLLQLGKIELVDNHAVLQRAFPGTSMSTSVITDQPMPSSDSKVYYFRARVTAVRIASGIAYAPEQILQLGDANITFERFLGLTAAERERLWQRRLPPL